MSHSIRRKEGERTFRRRAKSCGTVDPLYSSTFTYYTGVSDAELGGLVGTSHNVAQFDLSGLSSALDQSGDQLIDGGTHFHMTMDCGNDTMNGEQPLPDGGATIALLGMALVGLGAVAARKR